MPFDEFKISLDHVPPEFVRNMTLLTDLEKKQAQLNSKIIDQMLEYQKARTKSRRANIRKATDELFDKMESFGADKVAIAEQTYKLIDRSIARFGKHSDGSSPAPEDKKPIEILDMPPDDNEPKFCHCRNISYGEMVCCDNMDCPIEWFHFACVGLQESPKGNWYCSACRPLIRSRIKSSKSKSRRR